MWLLMLTAALADTSSNTEFNCSGGGLTTAAWPALGSVGVPIDALPVVVFGADKCAASWLATATLSPSDGESIAQITGEAQRGFLELVPSEPLDADSPYVLNVAVDGPEQVVTFQTGAELSDPILGLIAVLDVGASVYPHDGGTIRRVEVSLRGESVNEDPVVVRFAEGPPGETVCCAGGAIVSAGQQVTAAWSPTALPSDGSPWCVAAMVRNPDGTLQEPHAEVCGTVEVWEPGSNDGSSDEPGLCASGGRPAWGAISTLAWLWLRLGRGRPTQPR